MGMDWGWGRNCEKVLDTWSRGPKTPAPSHSEQEAETGLLTTSITLPVAICPGWQVAFDQTQWVLQHWRAPRWRDRAFCRTRSGLELRIRELIGQEHQAAVAHFPDWHPDVDGTEREFNCITTLRH